ncbi:hypothetical protein [Nonomuraea spiralis]
MVGQWGEIEPVAPDRCRLTMISTSLDWPTQALGNIGAEFEVLESPEFVDHLRNWGTRFSTPPTDRPRGRGWPGVRQRRLRRAEGAERRQVLPVAAPRVGRHRARGPCIAGESH